MGADEPSRPLIARLPQLDGPDVYRWLMDWGMGFELLPPVFWARPFSRLLCPEGATAPAPDSLGDPARPYGSIRYPYRFNGKTRWLCVPDPFAYERLVRTLVQRWDVVGGLLGRQDRPEAMLPPGAHRLSGETGFGPGLLAYVGLRRNGWRIAFDELPEDARFLVHTDIRGFSQAFGVDAVGRALGRASELSETDWNGESRERGVSAIVDALAAVDDGRKAGFPGGPFAIELLMELVQGSIGYDLYEEGLPAIRNMDDFYRYVADEWEARRFQTTFARILDAYGFEPNTDKETVTPIDRPDGIRPATFPVPLNAIKPSWAEELPDLSRIAIPVSREDAVAYMRLGARNSSNPGPYLAIRLMRRLSKLPLAPGARDYLAMLCREIVTAHPALGIVVLSFVDFDLEPTALSTGTLRDLAERLWRQGLKEDDRIAILHALHLARLGHLPIAGPPFPDVPETVIAFDDPLVSLLAWLWARDLRTGEGPDAAPPSFLEALHARAMALQEDEGTFEGNWLFAYETLAGDEFAPRGRDRDDWLLLKRQGVTFLRPPSSDPSGGTAP